jgi:hypothetical protein
MPHHCTICAHPDRLAIEEALQHQISLRTIARRWSVSKTSLLRHRDAHLLTTPEAPQWPQRQQAAEAVPPEPSTAPALPRRLQTPQRTVAEYRELLTTLLQYREGTARIKELQAVPEHAWPQRFTRPRAVVLANLRRGQRTLAERLRAEGGLRALSEASL